MSRKFLMGRARQKCQNSIFNVLKWVMSFVNDLFDEIPNVSYLLNMISSSDSASMENVDSALFLPSEIKKFLLFTFYFTLLQSKHQNSDIVIIVIHKSYDSYIFVETWQLYFFPDFSRFSRHKFQKFSYIFYGNFKSFLRILRIYIWKNIVPNNKYT